LVKKWDVFVEKIVQVYWRIPLFFANFAERTPYYVDVPKQSRGKNRGSNPASAKWGLTPREVEILGILRTGARGKDIARDLGISCSTVSKHVEHILRKMKVNNRTAAVSLSLLG
jgi:DNA-binding NarL/FixJ family response regulator